MLTFLISGTAYSSSVKAKSPLETKLKSTVIPEVNFNKASQRAAIRTLAYFIEVNSKDKKRVNFSVSKEVQGTITLTLKKRKAYDVLSIFCKKAGIKFKVMGSGLIFYK